MDFKKYLDIEIGKNLERIEELKAEKTLTRSTKLVSDLIVLLNARDVYTMWAAKETFGIWAEEEAKKRATKNQPPAANDQKSTGSIEDSIASEDIAPTPEGEEGETGPGSNPPEEASSPE